MCPYAHIAIYNSAECHASHLWLYIVFLSLNLNQQCDVSLNQLAFAVLLVFLYPGLNLNGRTLIHWCWKAQLTLVQQNLITLQHFDSKQKENGHLGNVVFKKKIRPFCKDVLYWFSDVMFSNKTWLYSEDSLWYLVLSTAFYVQSFDLSSFLFQALHSENQPKQL